MSTLRRYLAVLALPPAMAFLVATPAAADDAPGGDQTSAVAVNTEDGAAVFRLAFSIRKVTDGLVDQTNSAYALASCTDCQTVALAFQVVLVNGDTDVVVPENRAVAYNDQCVECLTYASATQIILGYDRPVRFTAAGRQRLSALRRTLKELEARIGELTPAQLHAEVSAAKAELMAILDEELVEAPAGASADDQSEQTTTTSAPATTTSTPAGVSSTTSSTTNPSSSTTTSTAPPTTTTTESTSTTVGG